MILNKLRKQLMMKANVKFYKEKTIAFRNELKNANFAKKTFFKLARHNINTFSNQKLYFSILEKRKLFTAYRIFAFNVLKCRKALLNKNIVFP